MSRFCLTLLPLLAAAFSGASLQAAAPAARPNIILIYADDLGYGDISINGATRVQTPNIDRIAREGLNFSDGHSAAASCTPSRYAMLTGEYAFRKKGTGILPGDAALIIEPGRATMASILQKAGYKTGVVGKWHLGLGNGGVDWNMDVKPGPLEVGFDSSYIMAATGDRVPCVFLKDHRVVGLDPKDPIKVSYQTPFPGEPLGSTHPQMLKMHPSHGHDMALIKGISRIGYMTGGKSALWVDEDFADVITREAGAFIERHKAEPFFLYFATHDIHVPRVPHPRFAGKTPMGPRGDAIAQLDWSVGEILATLDRLKLAENTLIILSSDNGPVVDDGYKDEAVEKLGDHKPAGPWRGGKGSRFEGATRVPFLVRWPARVKPGASGALLCQVDLPATFAALTGQQLASGDAPDSQNVLPALLGESPTGRDHLIEHGGSLAVRKGKWKLIPPSKGPKVSKNTNTETGNDPQVQLYDLATDPGEKTNVADQHPEVVKELQAMLAGLQPQPGRPVR